MGMSERKLPMGENLVLEGPARFIGGSTFLEAPLKGLLVLTTHRILFEEYVGRRNRRTIIRLEVPLNVLEQVKLSSGGFFRKPVVTLVYRNDKNLLEQPSFSVDNINPWKASFSRVNIGSFRIA